MIRHIDSSKVRVLFVSDHFGHGGGVIHGATRYFLTVLPKLSSQGVALSVAFLRGYHPSVEQLKEHGVEPTFFDRAKWNPWTVVDVLRLVRRERIQVIHAAGMKGIFTARLAGKLAGVPVIAHLHDQMPVPSLLAKPLRMTPGLSLHTLAVSRDVATHGETVLKIDPKQIEVLANGMDVDALAQVQAEAGVVFRRKVGIPEDARVIGIIGRLVPVKGHDVLLRAMPGVLAKEPNARLMIVGDGPDREALEKRAHDLGLGGYVFFVGHVTDVYPAIRAIDLCAMPSLSEGLPYVMLEAMSMERPIVASAVGGLAETLKHCENGVLVRPNDAQALTQAIACVLADHELRETIIQGGRRTARQFDMPNHLGRLATIYRSLAQGEPVPAAEPLMRKRATTAVVDRVAAYTEAMSSQEVPTPDVELHDEVTNTSDESIAVESTPSVQASGADDRP